MRVLKILMILFSFFVMGSVLFVFYLEFNRQSTFQIQRPFALYLYFGVAMLSAFMNILYHVKSFRFYRREEKRQLDKRLPKIFWIGTLCFSAFLVYIACATLYNVIMYSLPGKNGNDIFLITIFLIPGLFGFLEVSLLKKHIQQLRHERDTKNEINEIGN